ncbi:YbjN domain-containing protein [Nostocoides sp. HKS02]|uniref:YbjN domain-containing protein n=1 Tax=Nostocoides sp. HKS02 TaxID=1813880 RepID=UPI00351BD505
MSGAANGHAAGLGMTIESYLADAQIEWEPGARDGEFVLTLPGDKKLKTVASLVAGADTLSVSAFVIRNPDENHETFYRYLLRKNLRLPGLAYAVDTTGDVYVTGRLPAAAVDAAYLDQLVGRAARGGGRALQRAAGDRLPFPRCARSGTGASRGASRCATSRPSGRSSSGTVTRVRSRLSRLAPWPTRSSCSVTGTPTGTPRTSSPAGSTST